LELGADQILNRHGSARQKRYHQAQTPEKRQEKRQERTNIRRGTACKIRSGQKTRKLGKATSTLALSRDGKKEQKKTTSQKKSFPEGKKRIQTG